MIDTSRLSSKYVKEGGVRDRRCTIFLLSDENTKLSKTIQ